MKEVESAVTCVTNIGSESNQKKKNSGKVGIPEKSNEVRVCKCTSLLSTFDVQGIYNNIFIFIFLLF